LALDSTVVFSEVLYNPPGADGAREWIELHNQMAVNMDISGWRLDGGVQFSFAEGTIVPGDGYLVIAADPAALEASAGLTGVMGPFQGRLSNSGELLELRNNNDRVMDTLDYGVDGPWPVAPDGSGATLAKRTPNAASDGAVNWITSEQVGGTPGAPNFDSAAGGVAGSALDIPTLVFNEIASTRGATFQIELANLSGGDFDTTGYAIVSSDAADTPYVLPGEQLAAGGQLVVTESELGFRPADGDRLFLITPDRGRVVDARVVTGQLRGRSDLYGARWLYPAEPTFGAANRIDFQTDVVINEIFYHGRSSDPTLPVSTNEEWIELFNRGNQPVDLTGWTVGGGVDFAFSPGTSIGAGQYLVVAWDADRLAAKYPEVADRIVGNFSGQLSNNDELIALTDSMGNPADEVHYYDGGRWAYAADGGGSSLELRDPFSDNSRAEAWSASDETSRSTWQRYVYRGSGANVRNDPARYNEFLLGLLNAGELLLDDISVVEDPGGPGERQLIQDGSFDTDTLGNEPAKWRIIGTQHGQVVADPDQAGNQVLHLTATGPTEHMHNNAGTTLKDGDTFVTINDNLDYEISFRAKWLSGSNQLNSRLYFNRLARTTKLVVPDRGGTPGMPNSVFEANIGPTYGNLHHGPAVPLAGEDVTVTVMADDPDGIDQMTLFWKRNVNAWHQVTMTDMGGGLYRGVIPGKRVDSLMQFYVQGTDTRGATSMFPAAGPESRALYRVVQARSEPGNVHNFRIVMTAADTDRLHEITNVMSNDRIGATVIYDESEIFYNVGVRLKGSERGRFNRLRTGFNVQFDPQQLFRGVHGSVAIDRSGAGDQFSQKEILVKHGINHAGGIPGMYDDIIHIDAPKRIHTGSALLVMARYNDIFLNSQFKNGSQGTAFEYELIYYPTKTVGGDVEGLKVPTPDSVVAAPVANLGPDKEAYRWHWLIKNNRLDDDYSGLIDVVTAIGQPAGEKFQRDTQRLLDVDQWLRAFAVQILFGIGDSYATAPGPWHNMQIYVPPNGGKALFFPWDMDFTFSQSSLSPIVGPNGDLLKMLSAPGNEHAYFGHVLDILDTTFNIDYMAPWLAHYSSLLPREDFTRSFTRYITARSDFARTQLPPQVPFELTGDGPIDVGADRTVTLGGTGWVDVREIRLAGSDQPLKVIWNSVSDWELTLPVDNTAGDIVLEAYNLQGELVGTDTVHVQSSAAPAPLPLVLSEIDYHPADPTGEELATDPTLSSNDFEFIEVVNAGDRPLDVTGYHFTSGIEFIFSSGELAPGEVAVVARNPDAFALRYGTDISVVGEFASGKLSNGGETVELADSIGTVVDRVTYTDRAPWPAQADGRGQALVRTTDRSVGELPSSWYGAAPTPGFTQFVAAGDADRNGTINADDINPFVLALIDPQQYRLTQGVPAAATSDLDGDGDVDYDDIAGLAALVTPAPQQAFARSTQTPPTHSVLRREATDRVETGVTDRPRTGHHRWTKRVDRALSDETSWLPRSERTLQ